MEDFIKYSICILQTLLFIAADSLHCWKCQSYEDGACRDYFNVTKANVDTTIRTSFDSQQPMQEDCESFLASHLPEERAVCMKKVQMMHGRKYYTRKCEYIHADLPVGECQKRADNQQYQNNNNNQEDFCQLCATEFCNDADQLKTSRFWFIAVPAITFLLLRY